MEKYFKAVRPDGTDFHTGTVDYAAICGTGESLLELPGGRCCTGDVYHASTSAADTLIGGSWPCRLFEVEGEAVSQEDNKRGFRTLKVLRELPAWRALGPNGEQVVSLFEEAGTITAEQAAVLHAARDAARYAAKDAAGNAAWYAAWNAARNAAWYAARDAAWGAAWNAAWNAAKDAAWGAAGDAAGALVTRDLITEEQFNVLTGPWVSVMGSL
jgi:hypothetical protein